MRTAIYSTLCKQSSSKRNKIFLTWNILLGAELIPVTQHLIIPILEISGAKNMCLPGHQLQVSGKRTDNQEMSADAHKAFIYLGTGWAGVEAKKACPFF